MSVLRRPGQPVLLCADREAYRMRMLLGENVLTARERAKFHYLIQAEVPYPDDAEMALFSADDERGTEWIPVSQRTWDIPVDAAPFHATRMCVRIGDELLPSRDCNLVTIPGKAVTVVLPPTSWAEYVKRNGLPTEWADEDVDS